MKKQEFIDAIKTVVINDSVRSVESNLINPPGREPSKKLLEMSSWFNHLGNYEKSLVIKIIQESIDSAVFGFLCVLDGVRAIDDKKVWAISYYHIKTNIA